MTDDLHDPKGRMERAAENAWLKVLARVSTPLLLAFVVFVGRGALDDIKSIRSEGASVRGDVAQLRNDVRLLDAKVQWSVMDRMNELSRRVQQLEDKVSRQERAEP